MTHKSKSEKSPVHSRDSNGARSGVSFTMYFSTEQAQALNELSRDRRVTKATLVRYAVERLLEQLADGQLTLPFGMEE